MGKKISMVCYRIVKFFVWLFYPKTAIVGAENLPEEAAVIVGNHAQMNGPIACELYFPGRRYIWCAGQMMHLKEVPAYAYADFWSGKPRTVRWFFRLLSYLIAPLSVCVFNNAGTIPVYRDGRIISTFRETMNRLNEGASVIIFPEHDAPGNQILCEFQDKFIDLARFYYKRAGQTLSFVPIYVAPALKQIQIGKPIRFNPEAPMDGERERIREYLTDSITEMACGLPRHRVVPYRNIRKRDYPYNKSTQEADL